MSAKNGEKVFFRLRGGRFLPDMTIRYQEKINNLTELIMTVITAQKIADGLVRKKTIKTEDILGGGMLTEKL